MVVDCKIDTRQRGPKFYKFQREENLKQQWLLKMPECVMFIAWA